MMAEDNRNANAINFSSIVGRLKSFDGKSNFKSFINQFNVRARLESWDEDSKVNILRCLCVDTAQTYLNTNPEIEELKYDELVAFLAKRFQTVITKQESYSRYTSVRQNNLDVRSYADKIDEISEEVMEFLTEFDNVESRDQFLISIFINGLNIEIKKLVGIQEYTSYNACIQAALKAEKLLPNKRPINNVNEQERNSYPCRFRNSSHNSHNNRYHAGQYRNNYGYINYVDCFHCGEIGHRKISCPYLNRRNNPFPNQSKNY
ncbi:UNVERIFIED_CONTAM: hypothetical protein RMT77_006900 [Armadillidium vulgare]